MTIKTLEEKRKQLIFRSWHRGTKEMDMIMGRFADAHIAAFDEQAIEQYEELLQVPDPDIYEWVCRRTEVPANLKSDVVEKLLEYHEYDPE